jgi:hypothetical protein
MSVVMLKII